MRLCRQDFRFPTQKANSLSSRVLDLVCMDGGDRHGGIPLRSVQKKGPLVDEMRLDRDYHGAIPCAPAFPSENAPELGTKALRQLEIPPIDQYRRE